MTRIERATVAVAALIAILAIGVLASPAYAAAPAAPVAPAATSTGSAPSASALGKQDAIRKVRQELKAANGLTPVSTQYTLYTNCASGPAGSWNCWGHWWRPSPGGTFQAKVTAGGLVNLVAVYAKARPAVGGLLADATVRALSYAHSQYPGRDAYNAQRCWHGSGYRRITCFVEVYDTANAKRTCLVRMAWLNRARPHGFKILPTTTCGRAAVLRPVAASGLLTDAADYALARYERGVPHGETYASCRHAASWGRIVCSVIDQQQTGPARCTFRLAFKRVTRPHYFRTISHGCVA